MSPCHLLFSIVHALIGENVEDIVVYNRIGCCSLSNGNLDVYIVAWHDIDAFHLWLFFLLFLLRVLLQSISAITPHIFLFIRSDELKQWQPANSGIALAQVHSIKDHEESNALIDNLLKGGINIIMKLLAQVL